MALSPQDAELLARIMGGPLSQLQGMTAPPQITPDMAFGAPTMPGGFAPAGDARSIPQAAFGPMPDAMRAVPSPQAPRGGAFVPLVPGQGAAPQPYGGPDTPLARANFGGPPAPAPAPAMAAYGPMGGAAPGSAAFSPLPQAADRLSAIPPEQMPGGNMLGKVPMPEELAGYTVGLGPDGPVVSGGPVQSAVATNDAPMAPQQAQGGLGGLGGFFGSLFDPSTARGEDFQNMMLGWAAGAGGTWQDSLAGGAKMVAAGRLSRKEKDELAKSKNKTLEWAVSKGMDPNEAAAILDGAGAKTLIDVVQQATAPQKRETKVIGDMLVDGSTGEVIGDYGSADPGYRLISPQEAQAMGLPPGAYQAAPDGKISSVGGGGVTVNNEIGGGSDKQIFDTLNESAVSARAAATGLQSLREAKAAVDAGIITGAGADARLGLQKVGALLGVADPTIIQNTETFRSAIAPQVAAMMKATVGSTQISNADREFAQQAAGGSINLDAGSIKRLVDIMERAGRAAIEAHQKRLDAVYPESGGFVRERALFGVPMPDMGSTVTGNDPQSKQNLYDKYGLER